MEKFLENERPFRITPNFTIIKENYNRLGKSAKTIFDTTQQYLDNDSHNEVLVIDSFAGSGKTYVVALLLAFLSDHPNNPFIYFSKNHQIVRTFMDLYEDFCSGIAKRESECVHIIGKAHTNLQGEPTECLDEMGFDLLERYGVNTFYCKKGKCPLYEDCKHRQTITKLVKTPYQSFAGHFLLYGTLYHKIIRNKFPYVEPILIFDEDILNSFMVQSKWKREVMLEAKEFCDDDNTRSLMNILLEAFDECSNVKIPFPDGKTDTLERMRTNTIRKNNIESYYEGELLDWFQMVEPSELNSLAKKYDSIILKCYHTPDRLRFPNPYLILQELKAFFHRKEYKTKGFLSYVSGTIRFDYYRLLKESNKTIILNATHEPEIIKKLYPRGVNFNIKKIKMRLTPNQKIYRISKGKRTDLRYATYPKNTFIKKGKVTEKFYEIAERSVHFARMHKKTVVFCITTLHHINNKTKKPFKPLEEFFRKHGLGEDRVTIDSYAYAVGKNDYKDYDCCICFGTPYHNVNHFEKVLGVLDVDEPTLFRNYTINAIVQAIFRIRPQSWDDKEDKKCSIMLFTSLPIENELSFTKGHNIIKIPFKDYYKIVDPNWLSDACKEILNIMQIKERDYRIDEITTAFKGKGSILKHLRILMRKDYVERRSIKKTKGRGGPTHTYYLIPEKERAITKILKDTEWDRSKNKNLNV